MVEKLVDLRLRSKKNKQRQPRDVDRAGNPRYGCAEKVYQPDGFVSSSSACQRYAKYDGDARGIPTKCRQHSKAETEKRGRAASDRYAARTRKRLAPGKQRKAAVKILATLLEGDGDLEPVFAEYVMKCLPDVERELRQALAFLRGEEDPRG